ncbi:MAG: putative polymerase subfamily sigma factor [Thermoleophilia bacterium]|nr:putative polymerase subfamily sigma factor [Thermoleophilia bacterium]
MSPTRSLTPGHSIQSPDVGARPDDAVVVAASLVEPERFGELFERHQLVVHRYVRSRLGALADDVVGDTFAEAFRCRDRFDPERGTSALPWLLGIATNMVDRRRDVERRWLRRSPDDAVDPGDVADDADERLTTEQLSPWLRAALKQLRRRDRATFLLHVAGDLSIDEVATTLDIAPGTVKSRLHRARRILAAHLEVHR